MNTRIFPFCSSFPFCSPFAFSFCSLSINECGGDCRLQAAEEAAYLLSPNLDLSK